jgi:phosphatidylglycerol:prolipoprotein diacylglycerol transferase
MATITLNIDPRLHLGPFSLAWHGLMIALGIAAGAWLACRYAQERGLSGEVLLNLLIVLTLAGIVGSRLLFLILDEPGSLLRPEDWVGSRGFAFYGALIAGPLAVAAYLWRERLSLRYLDALAAGFPLGMAIGRIGDVISGEHYGPTTTLPWGFRYLSPHAEVPGSQLAYHQGGFYEVLLALAMLAILWPLRHRFRRPTTLLWTTVAFYSAGRFVMFFYRSDTTDFALGINVAQVTSLALLGVSLLGLWIARRGQPVTDAPGAPA